uniref:Galectin n=1 Tax=Steinernema glaseri TaxID=37863 RepID=A0A1I7ZGL3_9BILA
MDDPKLDIVFGRHEGSWAYALQVNISSERAARITRGTGVVRNDFVDGWRTEERWGGFPFTKDDNLTEISFRVTAEGIQVVLRSR